MQTEHGARLRGTQGSASKRADERDQREGSHKDFLERHVCSPLLLQRQSKRLPGRVGKSEHPSKTDEQRAALSRPGVQSSPCSFRTTREDIQRRTKESTSIEFLEVESAKRSISKYEQKVHISFLAGWIPPLQKGESHPLAMGAPHDFARLSSPARKGKRSAWCQ